MTLQDKHVFYIEDDVMNRAVVKMILEQAGAKIGFESWGRVDTVLARLEAFSPVDLILLDLMFPKRVSGYDIFDILHADPRFADVPVIAVSASDPEIELPRIRARGFAGYIAKPINLHTFAVEIEAILENYPSMTRNTSQGVS